MEEQLQSLTEQDVDEILKIAVNKSNVSDDMLRERLQMSANELGISPEALEAAQREYALKKKEIEAEKAREELVRSYKEAGRKSLIQHVITYAIVCGGLLIMNLVTSPREIWAVFPAMGWGIGVLSHAIGWLTGSKNPSQEELSKFQETGEVDSHHRSRRDR